MNAFTKLSSLITTDDIEKNESAIELAKAISGRFSLYVLVSEL